MNNIYGYLSRAVAVVAIGYHCLLVAKGDVYRWAYPLLLGATICRLLSVAANHHHQYNTTTSADDAKSNNGIVGRAKLMGRTAWERCSRRLPLPSTPKSPSCPASIRRWCAPLKRIIVDDNHSGLRLLSILTIVVPCAVFFLARVRRHVAHGGDRMHVSLANDFGKLSSASFCLLLVPVSSFTTLPRVFHLSDVHVLRMHIWAGTVAVVGAIVHGLYFVGIWIKMNVLTVEHLIPGRDCYRRGYEFECGGKFVVLTGIVCGFSMLILGLTSMWRARRRYYKVFYFVHVTLSLVMLLGLAMHDRQIVWYMAPSLLYYLASNVPVAVESLYKLAWHGGIRLTRVVHIPDSGGCVEITMKGAVSNVGGSSPNDSNNELNSIGKYCKLRVPSISSKSHPFTIFSHSSDERPNDDFKILFRPYGAFTTRLAERLEQPTSRATVPPGSSLGLQFGSRGGASAAGAMTYVSAIRPGSGLAGEVRAGDGLLLIDGTDVSEKDFGEVEELLRSRQHAERVLTFAPAAVASDDDDEGQRGDGVRPVAGDRKRKIDRAYPKIILNGIYTSCHQLDLVMKRHDDIAIIAGGAGIVTYISLISALRKVAAEARMPSLQAAVPPGRPLGLQFGSHAEGHSLGPATYVSAIRPGSALEGRVSVGDGLLSINELDVRKKDSGEVNGLLKSRMHAERYLSFAPLTYESGRTPAGALDVDEEMQGTVEGDTNDGNYGNCGNASLIRGKRIQVHWICRDEGLIDHVMENYFDTAPRASECRARNGNASMSIQVIVHHTRPPPKEPSSAPSSPEFAAEDEFVDVDVESGDDGSSRPVGLPVPSHASNSAPPASVHEGEKSNVSQNLLPSMTFASIVFGGMWIIGYCDDNINQGRQGIQNRLAPVLGIVLLSLGLSVLSLAMTKVGGLFLSKFAYSKLSDAEIAGEIECGDVHLREEPPRDDNRGMQGYNSMDDLRQLESPQGVMNVLHQQGRPDMTDIIGGAVGVQKRLDADGGLGVFVCGPNAMNGAVGRAVDAAGKSNVYLYQEVFEF